MRIRRVHALVGGAAALATVMATGLAGAPLAAAAPPPGVSIPCNNIAALDAAIVAANADTGPSTIVLATDCTYVLTSAYSGSNGLPTITEDVQLVGNFTRIERSTSAPDFRIIEISGTGDLTTTGIVYSNGIVDGDGGCFLMIDSATLTINGGAIHNCQAVAGGAIADDDGTDGPLTVTGVHLVNNFAEEVGGAIFINDGNVVKLQGSILTANLASAGGAIFTDGSVVLQNTAVYQNHAFDVGGGVLKDGGTVVLISSSVMNNTPDNCFPIASIFGCYL